MKSISRVAVIEGLDSKGLETIFHKSVKICVKHLFAELKTNGLLSNGTVVFRWRTFSNIADKAQSETGPMK